MLAAACVTLIEGCWGAGAEFRLPDEPGYDGANGDSDDDDDGGDANEPSDVVSPVLTITYPTQGQTLQQGQDTSLVPSGTAADGKGSGISSITLSLDGGPAQLAVWYPPDADGTSQWTGEYFSVPSGQHTLTVYALDNADNEAAPVAVTFTLNISAR